MHCVPTRKAFQETYRQGKDFQVQKSTVIFKTNVFKVIEKFRGLKKLSLTLGFLKNYYKHIKNVLKENPSEFAKVKVICLRKLFVKLSLQFIMLQKYSDKFEKCCKIFTVYLTIMPCKVSFLFYSFRLAKREIITPDLLEYNLIKYS